MFMFKMTHKISNTDPKYEEEVSGCTACVALITADKIYVVSKILESLMGLLLSFVRVMRVIHAVYSV